MEDVRRHGEYGRENTAHLLQNRIGEKDHVWSKAPTTEQEPSGKFLDYQSKGDEGYERYEEETRNEIDSAINYVVVNVTIGR